MEVGNQSLRRLEAIAGIDENSGVAVNGMYFPFFIRRRFYRPAGSSSDADETPPAAVYPLGGVGAYADVFRVHYMLVKPLAFYRTEGAESHVQQHRNDIGADFFYFTQVRE